MIKEFENIRELIKTSAEKFPENVAFKVKIREDKNILKYLIDLNNFFKIHK